MHHNSLLLKKRLATTYRKLGAIPSGKSGSCQALFAVVDSFLKKREFSLDELPLHL
jgi:hypothetical protein